MKKFWISRRFQKDVVFPLLRSVCVIAHKHGGNN
ncbi:hypothetical protein LINGRAPRIM_LOCUS2718 [Linum grandiflorum]